MVLGHEIGHAVYDDLSQELQHDWAELDGPEIFPAVSKGNAAEDFCNCYATYFNDPLVLLVVARSKYYFLYDYVFNQTEFS